LPVGATRTVVLSTCDSGTGVEAPGEGPLSLARAFLEAGAPTVVASLWPVADQPTTPLIAELHRGLRAGRSPAAALREAQLALLYSPQPGLRSPAVWAAFQALGG
ncbi:MAG TPA: CHAT domain-containing protein, partial [Thermoanaerobaculia bacterium]|nr:CHAT domain-containing protein [Thermoanaerobaculia bacterium]